MVTPFELAVWKVATVQYNYHISVERTNYSVLYEYIKQQVDVRLTRTTVEEHMPPDHQAYLQWNGERFLRWAEQMGQHTAAVVRFFLSAHKVEQQGYKSCMALLKLADRYFASAAGERLPEHKLNRADPASGLVRLPL